MAPTEIREQATVKQGGRGGRERRRFPRFQIPGAMLAFGFPAPLGKCCEQPLKDVSLGGIAFTFPRDSCIGRVHVGQVIPAIRLVVGRKVVQLDMLVMRVDEEPHGQMVCGGLAYWKSTDDFQRVKELIESVGTEC